MVTDLAIAALLVIPVMLLGSMIGSMFRIGGFGTLLIQSILTIPLIEYNTLIGGIVLLAILTISTLQKIKSIIENRRVLSGYYGEEVMWAGQLVENGDPEFEKALNTLPRIEAREVAIVAESKSELRELMIERHEKYE